VGCCVGDRVSGVGSCWGATTQFLLLNLSLLDAGAESFIGMTFLPCAPLHSQLDMGENLLSLQVL